MVSLVVSLGAGLDRWMDGVSNACGYYLFIKSNEMFVVFQMG